MIPLAFGVAIFDLHTRLARLETSAPVPLLLAALGAAAMGLISNKNRPFFST